MHTADRDSVAERAFSRVREIVVSAVAPHGAEVNLFGSWARGDRHRASDIDVTVRARRPLPEGLLAWIREALEEGTVPYRVDLVDLAEAIYGRLAGHLAVLEAWLASMRRGSGSGAGT